MMSMIPASRAMVLATGLVLATTAYAAAQDTSAAPAPAAEEKKTTPFKPTMYVGTGFGIADGHEGSADYGWALHALARLHRNAGLQLEYFDGADARDGLYIGVMPILPITHGLSVFGQVGAAFADQDDDVAGGGGLLYEIPSGFLSNANVDLLLRADYKYFNMGGGEHLFVLGFMFGFHK